MVDYKVSIKRPFSDIKKLLIGIVLQIIPIVNTIALGYQLVAAKKAMNNDFELPEWQNWGDLFVKGLLSGIIALIYLIIPITIIGISAGAVISAYITSITTGVAVDMGSLIMGAGAGIMVGLILTIFASFLMPMAILKYMAEDSFGAAFRIGEIIRKSFSVPYILSWLVSLVYGLVLLTILSYIPYVGFSIGVFIVGMTSWTIFGQVYSELK